MINLSLYNEILSPLVCEKMKDLTLSIENPETVVSMPMEYLS